jgi:hypothetical protein
MRIRFDRAVIAAALMFCQARTEAHPVLPVNFSLNFHRNSIPFTPISGSSRAFALTLKNIAGASIINTVQRAPLQNLTGQLNGTAYLNFSSGAAGTYTNTDFAGPYLAAFGNSNLATTFATTANITDVSNSFTTGLRPVISLPIFGKGITSGAERTLAGYYNAAAGAGYNTGIAILAHPTGGLLFGTQYYINSTSNLTNYLEQPGFFAFGNNIYNSAAVTQMAAANGVNLTGPLFSYLQFGKIIRPITNGILFGNYFVPPTYYPPFGPATPGTLNNFNFFAQTIGSNPYNTLQFNPSVTFGPFFSTYFK